MSIVLNNVHKKYNINTNNESSVLNGISLKINNGEMVAIQGRSGAGKSTLLHIIGCLDTPTSGEYFLDEKDISKLTEKNIAKLRNELFGFVMQDFGLINDDTVLFNVKLPYLLGNKKSDINNIEQILKSLGLNDLKNRLVENLSGGEKQRVAIARALINNPKYILADEPTGALDTQTAKEIMTILKTLHLNKTTIIIVTHDSKIAEQCDRIIYMEDGLLV